MASEPFALGTSQTCAELLGCDVDFVRLVGLRTGDQVLAVTTTRDGLPSSVDTLVGILGADGTVLQLESDDDFYSRFGFLVAADGDYVLAVSGTSDLEFTGDHTETGSFQLVVTILPSSGLGSTLIDTEPSNDGTNIVGSNSVSRGEGTRAFAGRFSFKSNLACLNETQPCDVDFFRVTGVHAGDLMTLVTYPIGNPGGLEPDVPDTLVGVFDASGVPLEVESEFGVGSRFDYVAPTDGTYFFAATGTFDDAFEGWHLETGPYAMLLSIPEPAAAMGGATALVALTSIHRRRAAAARAR